MPPANLLRAMQCLQGQGAPIQFLGTKLHPVITRQESSHQSCECKANARAQSCVLTIWLCMA
eukprot:3388143-Amphidinium_carterae.2